MLVDVLVKGMLQCDEYNNTLLYCYGDSTAGSAFNSDVRILHMVRTPNLFNSNVFTLSELTSSNESNYH